MEDPSTYLNPLLIIQSVSALLILFILLLILFTCIFFRLDKISLALPFFNLDLYRRADDFELFAQIILQESDVGKMQSGRVIDEDIESGRIDSYLFDLIDVGILESLAAAGPVLFDFGFKEFIKLAVGQGDFAGSLHLNNQI